MSDSNSLPTFLTNTDLHPSFDADIKDVHLIYDYAAQSPDGKPEKWRYEMWFQSSNRINYGHWENAEQARGDKRDAEVFGRWRGLAKQGSQVERFMLSEQADILESFKGKGDLVPVEEGAETF
ncbi:unnamed protein product [Aureobasidium pullulans]|nr:unnamed protein product [Aureobasidium pullulans]CAD0022418.1 unnamed protein product [Aureobasidium pullulans]